MQTTEQARAVAETYASVWLANDLEGILGCYADDFTLHYFGNNPFTGDHGGKQTALNTLLEVGAKAPWTLLSIDEILAGPLSAVIVATLRISVQGEEHEIRRVLRFRITGSQLSECWLYEENQALIDRAWKGQSERSTN